MQQQQQQQQEASAAATRRLPLLVRQSSRSWQRLQGMAAIPQPASGSGWQQQQQTGKQLQQQGLAHTRQCCCFTNVSSSLQHHSFRST
jgi:hypothetical protein